MMASIPSITTPWKNHPILRYRQKERAVLETNHGYPRPAKVYSLIEKAKWHDSEPCG